VVALLTGKRQPDGVEPVVPNHRPPFGLAAEHGEVRVLTVTGVAPGRPGLLLLMASEALVVNRVGRGRYRWLVLDPHSSRPVVVALAAGDERLVGVTGAVVVAPLTFILLAMGLVGPEHRAGAGADKARVRAVAVGTVIRASGPRGVAPGFFIVAGEAFLVDGLFEGDRASRRGNFPVTDRAGWGVGRGVALDVAVGALGMGQSLVVRDPGGGHVGPAGQRALVALAAAWNFACWFAFAGVVAENTLHFHLAGVGAVVPFHPAVGPGEGVGVTVATGDRTLLHGLVATQAFAVEGVHGGGPAGAGFRRWWGRAVGCGQVLVELGHHPALLLAGRLLVAGGTRLWGGDARSSGVVARLAGQALHPGVEFVVPDHVAQGRAVTNVRVSDRTDQQPRRPRHQQGQDDQKKELDFDSFLFHCYHPEADIAAAPPATFPPSAAAGPDQIMPRQGVIIELAGDKALVSTHLRGVCEGCADRQACGIEAAMADSLPENVLALNQVHARPGDRVEFDLAGSVELRLSFIVWGVPLVGLTAGAVLGGLLLSDRLGSDPSAMLGAAVGLAVALVLVIRYDRKLRRDPRLTPVITRVLTEGCSEVEPRVPRPENPSW